MLFKGEKMVICPDCGEQVPDAKYCKNCGAKLPEKNEIVEVEETTPTVTEEEISVNKGDNVKYCRNCGYEFDGNAKFCPNCGYDTENNVNQPKTNTSVQVYEEKNMVISVILSIIFPGLGHFYLGLNRKGAIFLLAYVVSAILILLLVGFILCTVIWIWALVDVIKSTNALNRGEYVEDKLL